MWPAFSFVQTRTFYVPYCVAWCVAYFACGYFTMLANLEKLVHFWVLRSDDAVLRCVLRCVMRCVFCIKYFTMLDIIEKLCHIQLLRQNSCNSCIKIEFCIFLVQQHCNWIMFEHKTHCVSRKNRNFSNFMRNAMRKTIVHLDEKLSPRTERT